ncbi:hypothetical protein PN462_09585 [Spirulina sp. CS-785/01]|uniref:hypothetical protein n=1 Tax=Spirulina sp. CS-785/01 TaxID=3021716 RepID=UPI00232FF7D3|nr:hypothetical protein [Spirulina sp. CS-785/01]MDB9313349.1 hypothetical protein [Spirulina sp. CS-785/01]
MTQPQLIQQAKQGNAKAIATLINQSLKTKKIQVVKYSFKEGCLNLMLEGEEVPAQDAMTNLVRQGLTKINSPKLQTVQLHAKKKGQPTTIWQQTIDFPSAKTQTNNRSTSSHNSQRLQKNYKTSSEISQGNTGLTQLLEAFHKQRLAILGIAILGCLATFLPWLHAPMVGSVSGARGDGWITLILFIPAIVLSLRGDRLTPLVGNFRLGATIPAGLAAFIGLWKISDLNSIVSDMSDDNPFGAMVSSSIEVGIGLYLLIAAGIALCVVAWVLEKR